MPTNVRHEKKFYFKFGGKEKELIFASPTT
jgi:hypothetical protein